jgi:hypothetical protein
MADRTHDLSLSESTQEPEVIEQEITRVRGELGDVVGELRERWRDVTDVRLQMRRHAVGVTASVLATGVVAAASVAWRIWLARRRDALPARAGRLREAVARMVERPERVAVEASAMQRIMAAAGAAVVKAALERLTGPGEKTGGRRRGWE